MQKLLLPSDFFLLTCFLISMWWIIFTAVDLYIGLVALDVMGKSLPPEKQLKVARAKKVIWALLVLLGVAFVGTLIRRHA